MYVVPAGPCCRSVPSLSPRSRQPRPAEATAAPLPSRPRRPAESRPRRARPGPRRAGAPTTSAVTPSAHTPAPALSSSAGAARCTADRLHLSLGRASPGAGNIYVPLVFTNTGKVACRLQGFPGVSLLSASGARIGEPAQREGGALPAVVLAPGKAAYASLHTVNEGVSDKPCWQAATWVQAYRPGSTEALRVPADSLRICGAAFDVSALRPGQHT
ncbi:DUF4232 domain-containing protein [Streptomyces xanthochromogenes]|uniref:DUF4232 domain-containing protein n=1 Tax=Streptomyces xanthochromogenes TaxID=67384 RepID=UPI003422357F